MQLSQGKYDNRSTSGSQYFQKRFGQSLRQSKDVNAFQNTYSKSPSFFGSQVSKVASQYEVFHPSNSGNQNFKIEVSSPKTRINPFLLSNDNKNFTNLQDKKYQRSSSQNKPFISNFINPNQNDEQKRRRITTYWKMFQTLEESSQQMGLNSRSSFKENPYFNKFLSQKNTQKERFVQPVTQRNYSPTPKQFASNIKLKVKKSSKQSQDQYHRYLEHIHCTISYQNSITQTFRKFASQQKQKINQRFSQILREIENTLKQIQTKFQTRVDVHYQQLLKQMANLKNMAEAIWKSKSQENNNNQLNMLDSRYRNLKLSSRKVPFTQVQRNGSRAVSNSPYTYEKLSNPYMRSPSSNNLLLNQLKKQDVQIQEYQNTKNFYFKENSQNPANKAQILKQMYQVSTKISETMKQAENLFYDEVDLGKHQRQRLFSWFNEKQFSSYKNELQKAVQNISCWKTAQISQICNLFDTFRSNLKYKYLQQQSIHQFQLPS